MTAVPASRPAPSAHAPALRANDVLCLVGVGLVAFAFRYLTISPIENDHFVMLARAQQVLAGDWPVRDFEDPGQPLFYLLTAGIAALTGNVLATNVVLCIAVQAVAAAGVYWLAARASGSRLVGLAAAGAAIASSPRFYNTTKVIVPVVTMLLQWRYVDWPGRGRLLALGAWTAVTFLLRHDYVVYAVASSVVLLVVTHRSEPGLLVRRFGLYAATALLLVAPWLLFVQAHEGLGAYVSAAVRFAGSEGRRTASGPPSATYYVLMLIPLAGLLLARRPSPFLPAASLASASTLVLLMNAVFLRDVLAARLPDVVAPLAVVIAAILGRLVSARVLQVGAVVSAGLVAVVTAAALARSGYGAPTPAAVVRQTRRVSGRLASVSREIQPNAELTPLVSYLSRCTDTRERVFVSGFGPELPFLAHRAFAAGLPSWIPGYYETPADVTRAVARLDRESVSAAVLLEGTEAVAKSWPRLAEWFVRRGYREHDVPAMGARIRVWLPGASAGAPRDAQTGLPCRMP